MREQDTPGVSEPLVELDRALGSLSLKVGRDASKTKRHGFKLASCRWVGVGEMRWGEWRMRSRIICHGAPSYIGLRAPRPVAQLGCSSKLRAQVGISHHLKIFGPLRLDFHEHGQSHSERPGLQLRPCLKHAPFVDQVVQLKRESFIDPSELSERRSYSVAFLARRARRSPTQRGGRDAHWVLAIGISAPESR